MEATPRLLRLADELTEEVGRAADPRDPVGLMILEELDRARRPRVHERRVASSGVVIAPTTDAEHWEDGTDLEISRGRLTRTDPEAMRRFADGLSSWQVRYPDGEDEWMVFDRPAGSERDLVVLASVMGATIVQRHPTGQVRLVDERGVARWDGARWQHQPPVSSWINAVITDEGHGDVAIVRALLEFAVHDLGALGVGALLIYRPNGDPGPPTE